MDVLSLYKAHKNMVFRLALSYTRSVTDAEDICQATFLKCVEHSEKLLPGKERAWLATVTINLCKDLLKSASTKLSEPLNENLCFETPEQGEIFFAVMELPENERIPIHLRYYDGCSIAEIASILHISQTAVTTRLERARKHLRDRLEAAQNV